jgi:hypothetical protein
MIVGLKEARAGRRAEAEGGLSRYRTKAPPSRG